MKYCGLTLDKFQEDSINAILKNNSVVVSAPTGSGKTLIADYLIESELKKGKRVVYTAPIKALSNQKYQEFTSQFGHSNIGILTGDVVINPTAPILIMTTEIYRNMLLARDPTIADITYVVFDEIHYISDIERGHIWEESIIFSPDHIRFLCLSATIPNAADFAEWIETIQDHRVVVISHSIRPVPLAKQFFDSDFHITTLEKIKERKRREKIYYHKKKSFYKPPRHIDLVSDLRKSRLLPAIYFVFSRAKTQQLGEQLGRIHDFLSPAEKQEVVHSWRSIVTDQDKQITKFKTTTLLRELLGRGIGFHHAGLLPPLKKVVEHLFSLGIIKVLYATETFAVGLNMPAKTVCFDSLEKFDGISFRYMNSKEYFQLAGRAGRRGIDKEGQAIAMINRRYDNLEKIETFTKEDVEPLKSQFRLSYNTVLNLIDQHTEEEIAIILRSSFDFYLRYGPKAFKEGRSNPLKAVFTKRKNKLIQLGYVKDDVLTEKGRFASMINSSDDNDMRFTEIFYGDFTDPLEVFHIILLVAAVLYEPRRGVRFEKLPKDKVMQKQKNLLTSAVMKQKVINNKDLLKHIDYMTFTIYAWIVNGYTKHSGRWSPMGKPAEFYNLLEYSNLQEGDLIRLFRQVIDVLSQVRRASVNIPLNKKLDDAMDMLNREYVEVSFE